MALHWKIRQWVLGVALLAALAALPAVAEASTASRSGDAITITAGAGEANDVRVSVECCGFDAVVTDAAGVTATGECVQVTPTEANCGQPPRGDLVASLGDGNDTFRESVDTASFRSITVDGGTGDDTLSGDQAIDVFYGGDDNDTISGGSSADQLFGEAGNDSVTGGAHGDALSGGPGQDLLEGDGSLFNYTNGGSDTIDSRDGEGDQVTCGYGADSVTADSADSIEGGGECESVDVGRPPETGGGNGPSFEFGVPRSFKLKKLLAGGLPVALDLASPADLAVGMVVSKKVARKLGVGRKQTVLGGVAGSADSGKLTARLKVLKKFRKKLARSHGFAMTVVAQATDSTGTSEVDLKVQVKR
jgi:hypothetical protein